VRITVGTQAEMERFQAAFDHVMKNPSAAVHAAGPINIANNLDGLHIPSGL